MTAPKSGRPSLVYTIQEVADLLEISTSKAYRDFERSALPGGAKVGGVWRISRHIFDAYLIREGFLEPA